MAEPNPDVASQSPGQPAAYRPLSGLALAGLGLALVFGGLLGVAAVVALVKGAPFFLPEWMLGIAATAAVISLLAQRQVRNSEGTLTGLSLARWGFWLSTLTGLGYVAFSFFTGLAVMQQADNFLRVQGPESGFFPRLQQAGQKPEQFNEAFLLTLTPSERTTDPNQLAMLHDRPEKDETVGKLTKFRTSYLIRTIARNGAAARIEPRTVEEWGYANHSYTVKRKYQITTPEATFEAVFATHSSEGSAGSLRQWLVYFPPSMTKINYTPLGESLVTAWASALYFVQTNLGVEGVSFGKFTDATNWKNAVADSPAGDALREQVLEDLKQDRVRGRAIKPLLAWDKQPGSWDIARGQLRFFINITLRLTNPAGMPVTADAMLVVESVDQNFHSELDLAGAGIPTSRWRVAEVTFHRVYQTASKKKD